MIKFVSKSNSYYLILNDYIKRYVYYSKYDGIYAWYELRRFHLMNTHVVWVYTWLSGGSYDMWYWVYNYYCGKIYNLK